MALTGATTMHAVEMLVDAQYAGTRARLSTDPEWNRLSIAADEEAAQTPSTFFARNKQALYLEMAMPAITAK